MNAPAQQAQPADCVGTELSASQYAFAPAKMPLSFRYQMVATLKDAKEVLGAITAIAIAIAFAINFFATSKALECFKAETKRSEELIQKVLYVSELTVLWKQATETLETLDAKRRSPALQFTANVSVASNKEFVEAKARVNEIEAQLKAARDRRYELERSDKPCQ